MSSDSHLTRMRWAVRAVLTLGVAASVTANVLHAQPNPISQTIAGWPPIALLLTVELISRIPVHRRGLAAARIIATAVIAGIAAWVSYWHMAGVAARYGETGAAAYLLPLSVDGLILVASASLVELGGRLAAAPAAVASRVSQAVSASLPADAIPGSSITPPTTRPATPSPVDEAAKAKHHLLDVPAGASPVAPAGIPPPTDTMPSPAYEPTNAEDEAMYLAWQRGITTGQEPSGADLARAAGRPDDATGVGRRAARRYREAHARDRRGPTPEGPDTLAGGPASAGSAGTPRQQAAAAADRRHNGHDLTYTGAAR